MERLGVDLRSYFHCYYGHLFTPTQGSHGRGRVPVGRALRPTRARRGRRGRHGVLREVRSTKSVLFF